MTRFGRARTAGRRAAIVLGAMLVVTAACKSTGGVQTGALAPDFVLPRLDGSVQKLSNHRGKVVVINLWATWCPPCLEEMPVLDEIVRRYSARGVVVLGLASDDDRTAIERFVRAKSPRMEILLDPSGAVGTQYGITGYPETFLVDREGRLRRKFIGPLPEVDGKPAAEVTDEIEALLGG